MEFVVLKSDWLEKQIQATQAEVRSWPEWMKQAGNETGVLETNSRTETKDVGAKANDSSPS